MLIFDTQHMENFKREKSLIVGDIGYFYNLKILFYSYM